MSGELAELSPCAATVLITFLSDTAELTAGLAAGRGGMLSGLRLTGGFATDCATLDLGTAADAALRFTLVLGLGANLGGTGRGGGGG